VSPTGPARHERADRNNVEVTVSYSSVADLWGDDQLVHLPMDRLDPEIRFDHALLPAGWALPADVPILFTVQLPESIPLFAIVEFQVGSADALRLVVLGAAPDNPDLVFSLDTASGVVALLDTRAPGLELVNSTPALFVEFLYRLARFLDTDTGISDRAVRAGGLRRELAVLDEAAFQDDQSWGSLVFARLTSAG
jgi:hypothetical protein